MSEFSKKIAVKLKNEKALPIPKWKFVLRRVFVFGFFLFLTILASLIFSILISRLDEIDWWLDLPSFVWLILVIFVLVMSYLCFKKTSCGYRCRMITTLVMIIAAVVVIGIVGYLLGFPEMFDEYAM